MPPASARRCDRPDATVGRRETGTAITAEWDLTQTFTDSWLSSISVYAGVLLYCLHIMEEGAEGVVRCLGTPANEISRSVTTSSILDFPRRTLTAVDWEEQTLNLKFQRWVSELWRRVYLHKYFEKKVLIYQRNLMRNVKYTVCRREESRLSR